MKIKNNKKIQKLVTDLYWDFDRLTSSGQETLEKLAELVGVPTEEELSNMSEETALQYEELMGN